MTANETDVSKTPEGPGPRRVRQRSARRARAIAWLRNEHQLRTDVLPNDRIEDARGVARVSGFFGRSSSATRWVLAALWTMTLGAVLAMTSLPGMTPRTVRFVQYSGYVLQVAGVASLVAAGVSRRRNRVRALIELRLDRASPATPDTILGLHRAAHGAEAWLVSAAAVDTSTMACAREKGVRCFVDENKRFRELLGRAGAHSQSPSVDDARGA
jgi:hypothetical protein